MLCEINNQTPPPGPDEIFTILDISPFVAGPSTSGLLSEGPNPIGNPADSIPLDYPIELSQILSEYFQGSQDPNDNMHCYDDPPDDPFDHPFQP